MIDPDRELVCVLGLPFDVVSMGEAVRRVREAARTRKPFLISTPNVNFVVAARSDASFRRSVLRSELILADGMPIVWLSRFLGLPLKERVSGADLFEALRACQDEPPLKVYFFGGPDGAAKAACEAVNRRGGGLYCVGHQSPGFVPVEEMSTDAHIEAINLADPDFVIVSLGAKKGQQWIDRNRQRLKAPVISHLGAVVNFAAGTVKRAPKWIQKTGFEWFWRICQEPALVSRYASDAWQLMTSGGLVYPLTRFARLGPRVEGDILCEVAGNEQNWVINLLPNGQRGTNPRKISDVIGGLDGAKSITVNLSRIDSLRPDFLSALLVAQESSLAHGVEFVLQGVSREMRRSIQRQWCDHLLTHS